MLIAVCDDQAFLLEGRICRVSVLLQIPDRDAAPAQRIGGAPCWSAYGAGTGFGPEKEASR